jgi:hypothetical protein
MNILKQLQQLKAEQRQVPLAQHLAHLTVVS